MFRLKVWVFDRWQWGRKSYDSLEAAKSRVEELRAFGIKAKVAHSSELFN